jgi:hypothetical protein
MNEQQKQTLFNRILNGIKQVPETVIDKGSNLYENIMFGREVKEPESSIENKDDNVVIQTGVNNGGRKGGLVGFASDVVGGAKENMNTTFKPQNLYSNERKGFGYRLGEGLGSAVRLLDNPLVRGAVAYGLSKHMGDSNPLEQGLIATGTNMRNKAVDRVYRNDLINSRKASLMNNPNWNTLSPEEENEIMTRVTSMAGYSQMQPEQQRELLTAARTNYLNNRQQEQIRAVENEINGYRGFIDNNIYDNMIKAQQLRDNAEYRQMYFDAQQRNLETQREWQRQQAEKENQLRQQQIATTIRGQNLNYALGNARIEADIANNNKDGNYENPKIILNKVEDLWKKTPQGRALKGTSKGKAYQTGIANALGMNNNDVSAYMAIAESMVTPLARQIAQEKGNVSDRDIARARAMLPQVTDSYGQGMAKINAVRELLNDLETGNSSYSTQSKTNKTQNKDSLGIL